MASNKSLPTLPLLPPSLKSISPFMLRAEELRKSDPVMAYWCTYYAAQTGLDLKSHEPGAREYLLTLITLLEHMKDELSNNDAVEVEAVGAAYIENFGLKVFANADSEDRKGLANRTTAKKFLAAANFLEVLKVFEPSNNAQLIEEKIRYAKWRASEIARAIREGRKPTPGPIDDSQDVTLTTNEEAFQVAPRAASNSPKRSPTSLQPTAKRSPPPPPIVIDGPSTPTRPTRGNFTDSEDLSGAMSPGNWSTVATPGSTDAGTTSLPRWGGHIDDSPSRKQASSTSLNVADELARTFNGVGAMNRGNSGSTLVDAPTQSGVGSTDSKAPDSLALPPPPLPKKVHFTPSVVGGLSSTDGSPPHSPSVTGSSPLNSATSSKTTFAVSPAVDIPHKVDPTAAPLPDSSPSSSSTDGSPRKRGVKLGTSPPQVPPPPPSASVPSIERSSRKSGSRHSPPHSSSRLNYSPPNNDAPLLGNPHSTSSEPNFRPAPPPSAPVLPRDSNRTFQQAHIIPLSQPPYAGPPSSAPYEPPVRQYTYPHQYPYAQPQAPVPPAPPAPKAPTPPLELTPSLIAKAQKHCRFAISALEYEDAEQAKKELRTALAVLGERYGP